MRLTGTDADDDSLSFYVSSDPSHGTTSASEFITKSMSRMFYTLDDSFTSSDTFQVIAHDGISASSPATITILNETLPFGTIEINPDSAGIPIWTTIDIRYGGTQSEISKTRTGPDYLTSAMFLESIDMEESNIMFTTESGSYTAAIPPSGKRMIEFPTPLNITSVTLNTGGPDEEAFHNYRYNNSTSDIKTFVGYVPDRTSCPASSGASGASGTSGTNSCPVDSTYTILSNPGLAISDNTSMQDTVDTVAVPVNGTLNAISVSLNITHTYIGDLRVILTSPNGIDVILHDRTGRGADDIHATYSSDSNTNLASIVGSIIAGDWTLSVGDYAGGNIGTLDSWELTLSYNPLDSVTPPMLPPPPPINMTQTPETVSLFSDDFQATTLTSNWDETGDGDWRSTPSMSHSVPAVPGEQSSNRVLHADNCDDPCILTMKTSLNMTDTYASANLTFWRFVDSGLDRDEHLKVEAYNGMSWDTIYHWSDALNNDDSEWHFETYDLTPYLHVTDFKIRIVTEMSSSSEDVQLDDINIVAVTGTPPTRDVLLFDDFRARTLAMWTETGQSEWSKSAPEIHSVTPAPDHDRFDGALHADECTSDCILTLRNSLDLSNYRLVDLTFWRYVDSTLSGSDYLKIEAYDGSSWNTIYHWSSVLGGNDGVWHRESYDLSAYIGTTDFKIKLTTRVDSSQDDVLLDDISIVAIGGGEATVTPPITMPPVTPPPPPSLSQTPLSDDFESGLTLWTQSGDSDWTARAPTESIPNSPPGNNVAHSSNCDTTCIMQLASPIDMSGFSSATLDMWRFVDRNVDSGEYLRVETYDGSSWSTAFDWSAADREDDDVWHQETYNIPAGDLVSGFNIRITAASTTTSEVIMVDDIVINAIGSSTTTPAPDLYSIYVTNEDNGSVHRYAPDGTFQGIFVSNHAGGLGDPWGLTFDASGYLYVSDTTHNKIMRYDSSGSPAGASSTDATWTATLSEPYGMVWHNDYLYVSSYSGVERFDSSGTSQGYFGHATNNPPPNISRLFVSYDVAMGNDGFMYASVLYPYKVFKYTQSDGTYSATVSMNTANILYTRGLLWDSSSLIASGDDAGKVVKLNPLTTYTSSYIDEPYGMDISDDGIIYVAVKDDDAVTMINGTTISYLFDRRANGMDDPRDVAVGPAAPSGASGASAPSGTSEAEDISTRNNEPEFDIFSSDGIPLHVIQISMNSTMTFTVNGTDDDGDTISYRLDDDAPSFVTITEGTLPNTAILTINATGVTTGEAYQFKIIANDGTEDEWNGYAVLVEENISP